MSKTRAPGDIRILPTHLANQLAAGEVVERPASVLKELLENSIDAGARNIEVRVSQGGVGLIQVRDDGRGIPRAQLALALSRHATSKLHEVKDLEGIASLGFRGEALPSIASVAEFDLISAALGEESAWRVSVDQQGRAGEPQAAAHPQGTTVSVRELFYNLPARRRFLRAARTELAHVQDVYQRMALSHFEVGFRLHTESRSESGGGSRLAPALDGEARTRRVGAIFGKSFLKHAREFEYEADGMRIWGWLAGPGYHRAQADRQFFFLNRRMVRDKVLNHALRQAFADLIEPGRHAAYALYLEIDPTRVDVNVHPTKHEVRFREARQIHDFVYGSLRHALRDEQGRSEVGSESVSENRSEFGSEFRSRTAAGRPAPALAEERPAYHKSPLGRTAGTDRGAVRRAFSMPAASAPGPGRGTEGAGQVLGTPLAQLDKYMLCRSGETWLLLNIAAAQAALRNELFSARAESAARPRPLLIPYAAVLPESEADALCGAQAPWRSLGFELTRAGPDRVVLRGVPALLADCDAEILYKALYSGWRSGAEGEALLPAILNFLADQPIPAMSLSEMAGLLRGLEQAGLAEAGSGLWRRVCGRDIEQWFDGGKSA